MNKRILFLTSVILLLLAMPFTAVFAQDDANVMGIYEERCSQAYAGENWLGLNIEMTEIIEDNPNEMIGEEVTIEGYIENVLDNNTFVVQDNEPFDFTPPEFIVMDAQGNQFSDLDIPQGTNVCVTGTIEEFSEDTLEEKLGYEVRDGVFELDAGDDAFALVASNVQILDAEGSIIDGEPVDEAMMNEQAGLVDDNMMVTEEAVMMDDDMNATEMPADQADTVGSNVEQAFGNYEDLCSRAYAGENFFGLDTEVVELIEDNPQDFYGTQVTVEGYIDEIITENGFVLQDNEPFDFTPPAFLVADPTGSAFDGMTVESDLTVCVTGTVYPYDEAEVEANYDNDFDTGLFNLQRDDDVFVLIADDVRVIDE